MFKNQPGYHLVGEKGKRRWQKVGIQIKPSKPSPYNFEQSFMIDGIEVYCSSENNIYSGHFADPEPTGERNAFRFQFESSKNQTILNVTDIYLPESLRGKGIAKRFIQVVEDFATYSGCERIKTIPGNRSGGVFWTMQGYDWDEPEKEELEELMQFFFMLKTDKPTLKGRQEFRFQNVVPNWDNMKEHFDEFAMYAELAEAYMWTKSGNSIFYAEDLLKIGSDNKFKDATTGLQTWAGKVYLSHAGGWTAWKNL